MMTHSLLLVFEENASYSAIRAFIRSYHKEKPTAFLAGNDLSAIGAIKALQGEGYQVPKDFSVIGFDDIDILEYFKPKLTTIHNSIIPQGELAVEHLIDLIENKSEGKAFILEGKLIERESTRKLD